MFAYVKCEVYDDVFFILILFIKTVDNGLKKPSSNLTIIYLSNVYFSLIKSFKLIIFFLAEDLVAMKSIRSPFFSWKKAFTILHPK